MHSRRRAAFGGILLGLAAGCSRSGRPADPAAAPHVVLQTDWYAEAEHGGYYQALVKGFYRDAGLDVEIDQGGPGGHPLEKVVVGQAHFAIVDSDGVIHAVAQGLPLVIVGAQLQHDPQAVYVHAASPVREMRDLDGRNVQAIVGASWIDYVQRHYHIAFTVTPSDFGTEAFVADPTAIAQGYLATGYLFQQRHVAFRMLPIFQSGYDPYRVLVARRDYVAAHPAIVKAFIAASARGWRDFMDGDPAAAEARIEHDYPGFSPGYTAFAREQLRAFHLVSGPGPGEGIGVIQPARLERQIRILAELGLLAKPLTLADVAVLDFQPGP